MGRTALVVGDDEMATVTELAPEIYRLCTHVPPFNLQFCQFLVKDEQPLLFHTGLRSLFPAVKEAVATLIDPAKLEPRALATMHGSTYVGDGAAELRAIAAAMKEVVGVPQ